MTGAGTCMTPSKGSDYIGDQDGRSSTCALSVRKLVFELEHLGLPFSSNRGMDEFISGPSADSRRILEPGGQAARTCAAADRTGHASVAHPVSGQPKKRDNRVSERMVRR